MGLKSWNPPGSSTVQQASQTTLYLAQHAARRQAAMEGVTWAFLLVLAGLPALEANELSDKDSPFYYDWKSLQLGGLICAGLLCVAGIITVLSSKCKCKNNQKPSPSPEKASPLITPGSASLC